MENSQPFANVRNVHAGWIGIYRAERRAALQTHTSHFIFVNCQTRREIDKLWKNLTEDGMALMELEKYPFSERYGWVQDKFGVSWQLNLARRKQTIVPFLMFVGAQHGKAEEAINFYVSIFKDSRIGKIVRYGSGEAEPEGTVKFARFSLDGQSFMAMDSAQEHPFTFTPATSLFVSCNTQKEIDYFWEKLSVGGKKGRCGWLEDTFGVSWQIIPPILGEFLNDEDAAKSQRVTQAMLQMNKIDIAGLKKAYGGIQPSHYKYRLKRRGHATS
jgi:predicted 3-demethylubiquinone-9 3-methyltransferase (glyoxalase superfamily)